MYRLYLRSLFVLFTIPIASLLITGNVTAATSVTLEKAVHFLATDGSDILIEPGTYQVEAAHPWLRLIPGERRDALLLEAATTHHDENISEPTVHLTIEDSDSIVQLWLPNGQRLEAVGTESGIRSRAVKRSRLTKSMAKRKTISRRPTKKQPSVPSLDTTVQQLRQQVQSLQATIHTLQTRLSKIESAVQINNSGITLNSAAKIKLNASTVEVSSSLVTVNSGQSKFNGVMRADTVITNSVVSSSYTPGAGNIW